VNPTTVGTKVTGANVIGAKEGDGEAPVTGDAVVGKFVGAFVTPAAEGCTVTGLLVGPAVVGPAVVGEAVIGDMVDMEV